MKRDGEEKGEIEDDTYISSLNNWVNSAIYQYHDSWRSNQV